MRTRLVSLASLQCRCDLPRLAYRWGVGGANSPVSQRSRASSCPTSVLPLGLCGGESGEIGGGRAAVWTVASLVGWRARETEDSGEHDEQHPIQEPDPGENRWALAAHDSCSWICDCLWWCWVIQWCPLSVLLICPSTGVSPHPCTCVSSFTTHPFSNGQ